MEERRETGGAAAKTGRKGGIVGEICGGGGGMPVKKDLRDRRFVAVN